MVLTEIVRVWAVFKSALGSFARAIASLVCSSSASVLFDSCSRLWDNRANEGEVCGVGSGSFICLVSVPSPRSPLLSCFWVVMDVSIVWQVSCT